MSRNGSVSTLVGAAVLACAVSGAAQPVGQEIEKGNHKFYVLENQFLRLTFNPETGRAEEAIFKPINGNMASQTGKFVHGGVPNFPDVPQAGLFGELLQGFSGPMAIKVKDAGAGRAALELTQAGTMPSVWGVAMTKTITLFEDSTSVLVSYTIQNNGQSPIKIALQPNSGVLFCGSNQGTEDSWYYMPGPKGVRNHLDYAPRLNEPIVGGRHPSSYFLETQPTNGWIGARGADGTAVVATMDWRRLDCLFAWADKFPGGLMDWACNEITVPPGKSFDTAYTFSFYTGLPSIDGAADGLAVGINVPEKVAPGEATAIDVAVGAGQAVKGARVLLALTKLPDGKATPLGEATLDLAPGAGQTLAFEAQFPDNATTVLTVTVKSGDKELVSAARPVTVGKSAEVFAAPMTAGEKEGVSFWAQGMRENYDPVGLHA